MDEYVGVALNKLPIGKTMLREALTRDYSVVVEPGVEITPDVLYRLRRLEERVYFHFEDRAAWGFSKVPGPKLPPRPVDPEPAIVVHDSVGFLGPEPEADDLEPVAEEEPPTIDAAQFARSSESAPRPDTAMVGFVREQLKPHDDPSVAARPNGQVVAAHPVGVFPIDGQSLGQRLSGLLCNVFEQSVQIVIPQPVESVHVAVHVPRKAGGMIGFVAMVDQQERFGDYHRISGSVVARVSQDS